jgi:hypothetical protein
VGENSAIPSRNRLLAAFVGSGARGKLPLRILIAKASAQKALATEADVVVAVAIRAAPTLMRRHPSSSIWLHKEAKTTPTRVVSHQAPYERHQCVGFTPMSRCHRLVGCVRKVLLEENAVECALWVNRVGLTLRQQLPVFLVAGPR